MLLFSSYHIFFAVESCFFLNRFVSLAFEGIDRISSLIMRAYICNTFGYSSIEMKQRKRLYNDYNKEYINSLTQRITIILQENRRKSW